MRASHAQLSQNAMRKSANTSTYPPPLPRKPNSIQPFYPQLAHLPRPIRPVGHQMNSAHYHRQPMPFQQPLPYNPYPVPPQPGLPRQNLPPKPQPRPVPMEIDQSLQTRNVNYMNRPRENYFQGKRPGPEQQPPSKYQRNYNIETSEENNYRGENPSNCDNNQQPWTYEYPYDQNYPFDHYAENQLQYYDQQYSNQENSEAAETPFHEYQEFSDIHFLD